MWFTLAKLAGTAPRYSTTFPKSFYKEDRRAPDLLNTCIWEGPFRPS